MSEMVEYIAKALSGKPEDVKVSTKQNDRQITITLELHEDDKGKVIGKGGRVAQSIRSLLRVAAVKTNTRAILEIK
ncbi:MAG: RNA-binding protein [Chloroflexi bacterium]|nr:RNA-binding protein [Chloroflexota bacterium]